MSDRFWLTKIHTLVKSINLATIQEILSNDPDREQANKYLVALETVLAQSSNEAITNASKLGQLINDASDRAIFNRIQIDNESNQVVVKHLLSGAKLELSLETTEVRNFPVIQQVTDPEQTLQETELTCSLQELFWWLWRCLPEAIANETSPNSLLIPASDNLPDASMWSDASLSAALAGALVGYKDETESRPQLVIFSFSPIQEMIKASRKMRDFWAGSWLLHYLSAHVCWNIANKYGADSLVYPSLYQQPLIDRWLLDKYPNFKNNDQNNEWIKLPSDRSLLTAGFPNVIVAVLPKSEVKGAMQAARQNLINEWMKIGDRVFDKLTSQEWGWMPDLDRNDPTWNGWLKAQWQTYWTALPLGKEDLELEKAISKLENKNDQWIKEQNRACNLSLRTSTNPKEPKPLFLEKERIFINQFINKVDEITQKEVSVNVGSWWPYTFDQLRFALSSVKKARTWTIPTAFTMRSTISGMGSVVTPKSLNFKREKENQNYSIDKQTRHDSWNSVKGVFDDREQLNATETVKRGLHFVLPNLLNLEKDKIAASYPDLCSGVAGWLRTQPEPVWDYYNKAGKKIVEKFRWTRNDNNFTKPTAYMPWGIPWIDEQELPSNQKYNPRLLNAGWAIEDFPTPEDKNEAKKVKQNELTELKKEIARHFSPGNNPTDWYVIAVGDGDGMGEWLKGSKLGSYDKYLVPCLTKENDPSKALSEPFKDLAEPFKALADEKKRMGPSTHNALSRALLDFSNRLVPYLTEERYAGRLIYSGGDDVFAYTNLWEWDKWLWDVQQCFRGANDPHGEFNNTGDYWQWQGKDRPKSIPDRPLFTMGSKATISFGLVIAHHSVPLAIALENVWKAEKGENGEAGAKDHCAVIQGKEPLVQKKDAVQVRVLFGNGNILTATSKFEVFHHWQELLESVEKLKLSDKPNDMAESFRLASQQVVSPLGQTQPLRNSLPALLELAAQTWKDHPAPKDAIEPWTQAFCQRRESLNIQSSTSQDFSDNLQAFLKIIIAQTQPQDCDREIENWLKLAAFVIRNREIKLKYKVNN